MACAQLVNGDFEEGANFDRTGIQGFCDPLLVQPWTSTHSPQSLFAAAIPDNHHFGCEPGAGPGAPGLWMLLPGIQADHDYTLHFWLAVTPPDQASCLLRVGYSPAGTDTLPASIGETMAIWTAFLDPTSDWTEQTSSFHAPFFLPEGASVFVAFSLNMPDINLDENLFLLDDLELTDDLNTGMDRGIAPGVPRLAPNPATSSVSVYNAVPGASVELLGPDGRAHLNMRVPADHRLDVSGLVPGIWSVRIGGKVLRLVKL